jgi:glycosyltransferase involved in cell wall biosynthesis
MKYYQAKPKLLFLYTELAGYFIACLRKLSELHDVEIYVIHWPVNKEAPFDFKFGENVTFIEKKDLPGDLLGKKIESIKPDFIYCSGWIDKDYLARAKKYKRKIPVVIGLDNQWTGSLKQRIACVLSRFTIKQIFTHCWVPGERQKKYALKLGFKPGEILTGYYSADVDYFMNLGDKYLSSKKANYPHRFIYAGRYYKFKGINDLWNAFIQWQKEEPNDWELWCIGTGTEPPAVHPKIKHVGFIQPEDFEPIIEGGGVFILPSHFEPWGVVLHEFASAGFPLIASNAVGSGETFIKDGKNGFIFKAGDSEALKALLKKIASLGNEELLKMGAISRQKALTITPTKWAETLMHTLKIKANGN